MHAAAEARSQQPGDERQGARPADDVDPGDSLELGPLVGGRRERPHQGLHRSGCRLDEGGRRVIEIVDGDGHDSRPGAGGGGHLNGDPTGLRGEAFLGLPALLEQRCPRLPGQLVTRPSGRPQGCGGQDLVEVVAAQPVDAEGVEHLVAGPLELEQRGVEGAAAEVVDDDEVAPGRDRPSLAVSELEAGRRGLVDHADHLEACTAARLEREEALCAVGVGRHTQDGPRAAAGLVEPALDARRGVQRLPKRPEEPREHLEQRDVPVADVHHAVRRHPRLRKQALERAGERHTAARRLEGCEAVDQRARVVRDHGGEVVVGVVVLVQERDHGVVAPVGVGDDGVRGAEIEAQVHATRLGRGYGRTSARPPRSCPTRFVRPDPVPQRGTAQVLIEAHPTGEAEPTGPGGAR